MTRSNVYGSPRRGPHPWVLVGLGVLLVGVLTGILLALQAAFGDADPIGVTRAAASAGPTAPAPASVSSRPATPSAPPSSARATAPSTSRARACCAPPRWVGW